MRSKNLSAVSLFLFFFNPVLGFLTSLFNVRSRIGMLVYIGFAAVFGYAFSFSNTSADSYRYAEAFSQFDNSLNVEKIVMMYQSGELQDLYRILLFYIVSLFTNNPKVLYAIAGLIYGIFSHMCLVVFTKERGHRWDLYVVILAIVFYTFISISSVNGFKFNTGALIFFYSSYQTIIKNKWKWIFGIIITPLFHYGFMLVAPLIIIYKFVHPLLYSNKGVNIYLYYLFTISFIASWFLKTNSIDLSFITQGEELSGAVGERINYVNSDEVTKLTETRTGSSAFLGIQEYFHYATKIYVYVVVTFLYKQIQRMKGDLKWFTSMMAFLLFFYSFAFIATSFPSGGRFMSIAHLFLMILIAKFYFFFDQKRIKKLILWSLPVFSFSILFTNFVMPFLILSSTFWYGNLFWIIIDGLNFVI